jgi:hypothetical protein
MARGVHFQIEDYGSLNLFPAGRLGVLGFGTVSDDGSSHAGAHGIHAGSLRGRRRIRLRWEDARQEQQDE